MSSFIGTFPFVHRFRRNPEAYIEQIDLCVEKSLESMYHNEPGSSLRFTKPIPAHEKLRQEFLQQLNVGSASVRKLIELLIRLYIKCVYIYIHWRLTHAGCPCFYCIGYD